MKYTGDLFNFISGKVCLFSRSLANVVCEIGLCWP